MDLTPEQRAWLTRDERLRERAALLAKQLSRDVEDIYRTLRQLERTPAERLALGLRHGRLHPDRRRADPGARHEEVDGILLPVLPLERILHSKRAAGRPKDLAAIHAIEDALAVLAASRGSGH